MLRKKSRFTPILRLRTGIFRTRYILYSLETFFADRMFYVSLLWYIVFHEGYTYPIGKQTLYTYTKKPTKLSAHRFTISLCMAEGEGFEPP